MTMPRFIDKPQPGFWEVRLAKGAPTVGCRIWRCWHEPSNPENWMDRSHLAADIDGKDCDPFIVWMQRGIPVSEARYRFLIADREWARQHAPHLPEATPRERVAFNRLTLPF